ncbi:MAG: LiaF domain-containing protein [Acidobacteriota bacterium]
MITDERPPVPITPQAVVGVLIIVVGALLMAGNLGWVQARDVLSFWPLGILAIGTAMFMRAPDPSARFSAGVVLAIGGWLTFARVFHLGGLSLKLIWPLILIGIGGALISRAWRRGLDAPINDQVVSDFAFWSGIQRKISSPLFRRADFTAVMGGIEVDLRQASTSGEAVIDVFVVMGGLEIKVPPDWMVSNQIVAIMGGVSDKSTGVQDAKNRLIIRGFAMMGGVEVKS